MFRRSLVTAAVCAAALAGSSVGIAGAGETTGNGKPTAGPTHANSICAFSGQNDDPTAPITEAGNGNGPGGRTQSWGQDVRYGIYSPHVFNPGDACRGGSNPDNPPTP